MPRQIWLSPVAADVHVDVDADGDAAQVGVDLGDLVHMASH